MFGPLLSQTGISKQKQDLPYTDFNCSHSELATWLLVLNSWVTTQGLLLTVFCYSQDASFRNRSLVQLHASKDSIRYTELVSTTSGYLFTSVNEGPIIPY